MTALQRLARNIATNWFGLLVNVIISFFLAPFVVNKLGSTYYGVWAITMQFTGYLYLLDFGVREAVVRYVSKFRAIYAATRLNEVIRVALEVYFPIFLLAIILSLIGALIFPFIFKLDEVPPQEAQLVVLLVGLTIAQTFLFNVFVGVLHGFQRFDISNYVGIAVSVVRAGMIVLILNAGYGIVGLSVLQLLVSFVGGSVGFLLALLTMKNEGFQYRWVPLAKRRRIALIRRMVGYSVYVFVINIGQKTSVAAGSIVIAMFLPIAAVTPYAIAGSLANYVKSLMVSSAWVFNPLVSHHAALKDRLALTEIVRRGSKLPLVVGLPVTIAYMLVGDIFIELWMGPQFVVDTAAVLMVFALMETVSAPHHVLTAALYGMSKLKALAVLRLIEAVTIVVLSAVLVQTWGVVGVAIGALVPHMIVVLLAVPVILRRHIDISFYDLMWGVYIKAVLGVVPFALSLHLLFEYAAPDSLAGFFMLIMLILPIYVGSAFCISLDAVERRVVSETVMKHLVPLRGPGNAKNNPAS